MYYRSVNRGVSLTAPGRYTILLLLALGLIAIASGYNGVYLALSMGFATLIISGLLSEKVMKHYELQSVSDTTAEPLKPFSLRFRAMNRHHSLVIYGIENLLLTETPRFGLLSPKLPALMQSTVLNLAPNTTREWSGTCGGLPRGLYREFIMVQRTVFPFGLLAKFKVSKLPARVSIPPRFEEALGEIMRQELRGRVAGSEDPREFQSHRPYSSRDSLRHVDWKKSAGHEAGDWVVKLYEAVGEDFGLLIDVDWSALTHAPDETAYESALATARTALEIGREAGLPLVLRAEGRFITSYETILDALVRTSKFAGRADGLPTTTGGLRPAGAYLHLHINGSSHVWAAEPYLFKAA